MAQVFDYISDIADKTIDNFDIDTFLDLLLSHIHGDSMIRGFEIGSMKLMEKNSIINTGGERVLSESAESFPVMNDLKLESDKAYLEAYIKEIQKDATLHSSLFIYMLSNGIAYNLYPDFSFGNNKMDEIYKKYVQNKIALINTRFSTLTNMLKHNNEDLDGKFLRIETYVDGDAKTLRNNRGQFNLSDKKFEDAQSLVNEIRALFSSLRYVSKGNAIALLTENGFKNVPTLKSFANNYLYTLDKHLAPLINMEDNLIIKGEING